MKKATNGRKTAPSHPHPNVGRKTTRRWFRFGLFLLVGIVAASMTFILFENLVWAKIPPELVGKWVVEGGEQDGATFDFFRNGTMRGTINVQGREGIIDARVHLEGDTLVTTTRHPTTGEEKTTTQTVRTLDKESLTLVDQRGEVLRLSRAD